MIKNIVACILDAPPEVSCHGKVRFRTMKKAINSVKNIKNQRQYRYKPMTTNIYHCQYCDGWHLGNKPKSELI